MHGIEDDAEVPDIIDELRGEEGYSEDDAEYWEDDEGKGEFFAAKAVGEAADEEDPLAEAEDALDESPVVEETVEPAPVEGQPSPVMQTEAPVEVAVAEPAPVEISDAVVESAATR